MFYSYREGLTKNQWHLLKAIAREGEVREPTSGKFASKHLLGTSASVLRALQTLQKKELIFKEIDASGASYYGVYDVLFMRWISS